MKRLALILTLLLVPTLAWAQLTVTGVGGGFGVSAGGAFTGPGDIISYDHAYGMMAYTSATRGNKLINACNSTGGVDVLCGDLFSDSITGLLDPGTIGGITCTGTNCTIKTFYDIAGGGVDCTNTTVATRSTLSASGGPGTSHPNGVFLGSSSQTYSCAVGALSQPFIMSAIMIRTGATGSFGTAIGNASPEILFNSSANACGIYAGSVFVDSIHCADSAWHA